MRLTVKQNFMYGGRLICKGQQMEVSEADGANLIEKGFAQLVEKNKPKKKNAIKSVEA